MSASRCSTTRAAIRGLDPSSCPAWQWTPETVLKTTVIARGRFRRRGGGLQPPNFTAAGLWGIVARSFGSRRPTPRSRALIRRRNAQRAARELQASQVDPVGRHRDLRALRLRRLGHGILARGRGRHGPRGQGGRHPDHDGGVPEGVRIRRGPLPAGVREELQPRARAGHEPARAGPQRDDRPASPAHGGREARPQGHGRGAHAAHPRDQGPAVRARPVREGRRLRRRRDVQADPRREPALAGELRSGDARQLSFSRSSTASTRSRWSSRTTT